MDGKTSLCKTVQMVGETGTIKPDPGSAPARGILGDTPNTVAILRSRCPGGPAKLVDSPGLFLVYGDPNMDEKGRCVRMEIYA